MKQVFFIFFLLFGAFSFGQDLHLSQFYTNQMNLNPAMASRHDGAYRFAGNYRNQWREIGKPLTTMFLALDKKIYFFSDEIDLGVMFNEDQFSGFNQKTNKIMLNGVYTKRVSAHKISAGLQLGVVLKSTDLTTQTFPNQWVYETGEFNSDVSNGETSMAENQTFFDANFGVVWSKKFGKMTPIIGFSLFHFNRPKATYFNDFTERLRARKTFSAELDWKIKEDISLEPKLLYMWTTKSQDLVFGTNLKKHLDSKVLRNVFAGVLMRTGVGRNHDAVIPVVGMGIKRFDIGLSYDINISTLSHYNSKKSSLELSVIYTTPMYNPSKLSIPCDRY